MGNLIEAVKSGDAGTARRLLEQGAATDERDEHDWTPLHWAAGRGDVELVRLLLERNADMTAVARDLRSPLDVALAAERRECVDVLREAAAASGIDLAIDAGEYCCAFTLGQLRQFSRWSEHPPAPSAAQALPADDSPPALGGNEDDAIVFLHEDYSVTRGIFKGEDVVFDDVTPEWIAYCSNELRFTVPSVFDF